MKDHEIARLVNELRGIANEYAGTEQLRGRISECVNSAVAKEVPVYEIGMRGEAYDQPGTARAYTYSKQPGNVIAWKLGRAARAAVLDPGGDNIDQGLSLLHALEGEGFGVFGVRHE